MAFIKFVSNPTTAPAIGPQSAPDTKVPIASRYNGNLSKIANWPPTRLMAIHTGTRKKTILETAFELIKHLLTANNFIW
jgi:hypothetical protein